MGGGVSKAPPVPDTKPEPGPEFGLDVGENLESSLRKLIPLVHAGDTKAQQQAASCLANLAVQDEHQVTIVKQGGLLLLVPLMTKGDVEVQRLAAHAVANLAVNGPASLYAHRPALPISCIAAARRLLARSRFAHGRVCSRQPAGHSRGGWNSAADSLDAIAQHRGTATVYEGDRQSSRQRYMMSRPTTRKPAPPPPS